MRFTHAPGYAVARALKYPKIEELADALVHQANGNNGPMEEYIAKCNEVKAQYPKPEDDSTGSRTYAK